MAKPTKDNRKSVVDFGVGWVVIIYCLLMFFLYVGMCNDGANITAPNVWPTAWDWSRATS